MTALRVLAIDSAFGPVSVATAHGAAIRSVRRSNPDQRAAEHLPGLCAAALTAAGWRIGDLDRIVVTLGPGGFTALRAGLAFAKGIALAAQKPLLGLTTLEALAATANATGRAVMPVIDASRGEAFWQIFDADIQPLCEPRVTSTNTLADAAAMIAGRSAVACGSGALLAQAALPGLEALPLTSPSAEAIAVFAQRFAPEQRPADAVYLRPADARPASPAVPLRVVP